MKLKKKGFDFRKNRYKEVELNGSIYTYIRFDGQEPLVFDYLEVQEEFKQEMKQYYCDIQFYCERHKFNYKLLNLGLNSVNPSPKFNMRLYNMLEDIKENKEYVDTTIRNMFILIKYNKLTSNSYVKLSKNKKLSKGTITKYMKEYEESPDFKGVKLIPYKILVRIEKTNNVVFNNVLESIEQQESKG